MLMPGRKFSCDKYPYGFQSQERSTEINDNSYTAEFWQYDSRIGRRWNTDPVPKVYESPYAAFGNNSIWLTDHNGKDTIIFNKAGKEINRFIADNSTRHVYLLDGGKENQKGASFDFHGKKYFRGFSYFSLFGDPDGNEKPTLAKTISKEIISLTAFLDEDEEVKNSYSDSKLPAYSKRIAFWQSSGYEGLYDYKNSGILGQNGESTVYEIEGIIYNRRELGMMKWGYIASGAYSNYSQLMLHNNLMHQSVEGNGDEWNEMYSWTFGYVYGKNKQPAIATHNAADVQLKTYNSLYWYLPSPYRGDPGFKETPDTDNWKTKIKRANILLIK